MHYRYDESKKPFSPFLVGVIVFAVVAFLLSTVAFGMFMNEDSGNGRSSGENSNMKVADASGNGKAGVPAKLANATEQTDANGVITGVTQDGVKYRLIGRGDSGKASDKVTLVAAGDQIGTDNSMPIADRYAGGVGDGQYDFTPFYQEVAPFIKEYDLRYMNQETCMAGADAGYSGYPVFNSPDACAEAIRNVGFNMVSFCSNHSLDYGINGSLRTQELLNGIPNTAVAGSYSSQDDRDTVRLIEVNGRTFAFLAYTYGDNRYGTAENFPNSYILAGFDKDTMSKEIQQARKVADAVIVAMHWGSEYTVEPNDQQWDYAKFLADQGVDLILGSHAHSMQPTKYVTGENGKTIPVVFGLSDFVSGWTLTDTILSGLFTCEFTFDKDGNASVTNLLWYPTIEWSNGGNVYVRMLHNMDEATINSNTRTDDVVNDYTYLKNKIESAGMDIKVVW